MKEKKYYLSNTSLQNVISLGFHYSSYEESYIYSFPILKYGKRPMVLCKLYLDIPSGKVEYNIVRPSGELVGYYYDREYGNAKDLIKKINDKISRKLKLMGIINKNKIKGVNDEG